MLRILRPCQSLHCFTLACSIRSSSTTFIETPPTDASTRTSSIPTSAPLLSPTSASTARSTTILTPPAASPHHTDLPTFLNHARLTSLSTTAPTYIGTLYEYLCLLTLRRLGFTLTRTGGKGDRGIDLLGTWQLPSFPYPLRVVVSCKALQANVGPSIVREMEGALRGARISGWRGERVVGVVCAGREATKGVREAVRVSERGLVWIFVQMPTVSEDGFKMEKGKEMRGRTVKQILWNDKVRALGVEGVGVQVRYIVGEAEEVGKEAVLTWKGEVWEPQIVDTVKNSG